MTRLQKTALNGSVVVGLYLACLFDLLPLPLSSDTKEAILPVLPWWALVSFGAYCLASLGWGIISLQECTPAYEELLREVGEAKNDLRAKGVSVD